MEKLRVAMHEVSYAEIHYSKNLFYQTFVYSKLMEVFEELKLFDFFLKNRKTFKNLNLQQNNFAEVAFTDLKYYLLLSQSDKPIEIGESKIDAQVKLMVLESVVENLTNAQLYEKAIEILNQMKDFYEVEMCEFD